MTSLKATLEQFQRNILATDAAVENLIKGDDRDFIQFRLSVYQDAYRLRLIEVLSNEFPKLKQVMGEEFFDQVAQQYIENHPSKHYSLHVFGQHFSEFLTEYKTPRGKVYAELAQLEWTLSKTADASGEQHLGLADLSQLQPEQWETIRFNLHASVQIIESNYAVVNLWYSPEDRQLEQLAEPQYAMVWRMHADGYITEISALAKYMLEGIQAGLCFGEVCAGLSEVFTAVNPDELTMEAAQNLRQWLEQGVFAGYYF